jgi:hypothetical protein
VHAKMPLLSLIDPSYETTLTARPDNAYGAGRLRWGAFYTKNVAEVGTDEHGLYIGPLRCHALRTLDLRQGTQKVAIEENLWQRLLKTAGGEQIGASSVARPALDMSR